MLRGACFLYMLSRKYNFECYIDVQHHPISDYLAETAYPFAHYMSDKKSDIDFHVFTDNLSAASFIDVQLRKQDITHFLTNGSKSTFREPGFLSADCLAFMRRFLTLKPEIELEIASRLPNCEYDVLHVRLGDEHLVENKTHQSEDAFECLYRHLESYMGSSTLFLSDSPAFRRYMASKPHGMLFLPIVPSHFGLPQDGDGLLDTLTEFSCLQRARAIHSYTIYNWDSGFAKSASLIYGVPMHRIDRIKPWMAA